VSAGSTRLEGAEELVDARPLARGHDEADGRLVTVRVERVERGDRWTRWTGWIGWKGWKGWEGWKGWIGWIHLPVNQSTRGHQSVFNPVFSLLVAIHTHVSHTLSRAVGVSEVGMAAIAPSARRITSSGCEADSAAAAARTWSGSGSGSGSRLGLGSGLGLEFRRTHQAVIR
jgi:hypothetical protein